MSSYLYWAKRWHKFTHLFPESKLIHIWNYHMYVNLFLAAEAGEI